MKQTLYFGGKILTMDEIAPRVEALLTENGKIAAVGAFDALRAAHPHAICRNLQGKTLMPAFVDGHSHMPGAGKWQFICNLNNCTDHADLLGRIAAFRKERNLVHGEVIRANGYDPETMAERAHPTAALLDSLGFDNPIVCNHQSGHVAVYNSAAMAACGVDDSYEAPAGGFAGRDENGHLTGYFEETAKAPFAKLINLTDEEIEASILAAQDVYLANGITTVQDGSGISMRILQLYRRLAAEGKLKVDVVVYVTHAASNPELWEEIFQLQAPGNYENRLKIGGIKIFLDGSPQARTAWMRRPYEGETDYCGYPKQTDEWVKSVLDRAIRRNLQVLSHCNGDAACQQFLDCWETAVRDAGHGQELRPVMVHAQTVGDDQLDRMGVLGMMPSFFVGHCWFWGDAHLRNFGARGHHISPVRAALERNLPISFHQDSPVTPPNMLHSIWCAVNRQTRGGQTVGADQAVTPMQALTIATRGGAYGYFEEDAKGILKPGARADLIILSADPTEAEDIRDIAVEETLKDGETVYIRK